MLSHVDCQVFFYLFLIFFFFAALLHRDLLGDHIYRHPGHILSVILDIEKIERGHIMEGYNTGSHCIYKLTYHLIFVTKYRRPVITDRMGDRMKEYLPHLMRKYGGELISAETDRDHIHILVSLPPSKNLGYVIRSMKSMLSKEMHAKFAEDVKKYLYGDCPFWSPSYFAATTGSVSLETVKEYIEAQRTDDHKRKYVRSGKYKKK